MEKEIRPSLELIERARRLEEFCETSVGPALERIVGIGITQILDIGQRENKEPKLIFLERDAHILATIAAHIAERSRIRLAMRREPYTRDNTVHASEKGVELLRARTNLLKREFLGPASGNLLFFMDSGRHGSVPDVLSSRCFSEYDVYIWMVQNDYEETRPRIHKLDWRKAIGDSAGTTPSSGLYFFIERYLTGVRQMVSGLAPRKKSFLYFAKGSEERLLRRVAYKGVVSHLRHSQFNLEQLRSTQPRELQRLIENFLININENQFVREIETDEPD